MALLAASLLLPPRVAAKLRRKNVRREAFPCCIIFPSMRRSRACEQLSDAFNQTSQAHRLATVAVDHESFKASILDDLRLGNPPTSIPCGPAPVPRAIAEQLAPIDDILPLGRWARLHAHRHPVRGDVWGPDTVAAS